MRRQLSGRRIRSLADAWGACDELHGLGPRCVLITSIHPEDVGDAGGDGQLLVLASQAGEGGAAARRMLVRVPKLPLSFTGTGDLLAALVTCWWGKEGGLEGVLREAVSTLQSVCRHTMERGGGELRLVECKAALEGRCEAKVEVEEAAKT